MSETNNFENENFKELILVQLSKIGKSRVYLWTMVLLCLTPSIFNGFHASSYIFLTENPDEFWCMIPELSNLTREEIQEISSPKNDEDSNCVIYDWNYEKFRGRTFEEINEIINGSEVKPDVISCGEKGSYFQYLINPGISIVPEWDLICDRKIMKTNIQMALAVGKFTGAFFVGIIADR